MNTMMKIGIGIVIGAASAVGLILLALSHAAIP